MKTLVLEPQEKKINDGFYTRSCIVKRVEGDAEIGQETLWFQFPQAITPPEDIDCDSYLLAMLMEAMQEGRKIIVKGSVSGKLLSNIIELQGVWHKWLPNIYRNIDIEVYSVRTEETPVHGAVCAFSGGVDGAFTAWRHSQKKISYRSYEIIFCSLVHGFDIPLDDNLAFKNAYNRASITLADIGIKAVPISTNYKKISVINWEHSFAAALVATLSNFKQVAGTCLVGSSEPYDHLILPWGSSPVTDHLLSSGTFEVIHDGATHSRTEKVNEIAKWKKGTENLRVCWQGDLKDRNCGRCEKCLRTKLNFLATGNPIPSCFHDYRDDIHLSSSVVLSSDAVIAEWRQLLKYAREHNIKADWIEKVEWILLENSFRNRLQTKWNYLRYLAGKVKEKLRFAGR
jgi:hypothetical protein